MSMFVNIFLFMFESLDNLRKIIHMFLINLYLHVKHKNVFLKIFYFLSLKDF